MNNYICIVTKIRAMQKNLLDDKDYDKLSKLHSMTELVEFFKSHPTYAPYFSNMNPAILHRSEIEKRLYKALNNEFTKIYKFSDLETRKFLKAFAINFMTLFIKKTMHSIYRNMPSDIDQTPLHDFFKHYTSVDPEKLMDVKTLPDLIETLKETEIYEQMKNIYDTTGDQFVFYETYLDSYFFHKIWNLKFRLNSQDDIRYIRKVYGITIDLLNIITVYRSKKYYKIDDNNIIPLLVPINYRLSKDEINEMVHSEDLKGCINAINKTYYSSLVSNLDNYSIGSIANEIIKASQKKLVRQNAYSIASIGAYFFMRQQEILSLITITEGLKYKIGYKEIQKYFTTY